MLKSKFYAYFVFRYNEAYESAKFNLHKQLAGETLDQFLTALFVQAELRRFQIKIETDLLLIDKLNSF